MAGWPIYCSRGNHRHLATHLVTGATRSAVCCQLHLDAVKRWAGPDAAVEAVEQPADTVPADGQQELF